MKDIARLIDKAQQPAVKCRPAVLARQTRPIDIENDIKQVLNTKNDKKNGYDIINHPYHSDIF